MAEDDQLDHENEFVDAQEFQDDSDGTPKATAASPASSIPQLALVPDMPAVRGNEPVRGAGPAAPSLSNTPTSLMPPPRSQTIPNLQPLPPNSIFGLGVASSGTLPRRDSPAAPAANTAGKRNKVFLSPGHSPLDWAALCKSKNLSGVSSFQRVTPSMLKYNHGRKGRPAWATYRGKVYNIGPYLPFHPGGEGELRQAAGKDGEKLFNQHHPWVNWDNMLSSCLVGVLVSEQEGPGLEDID